MNLAKEISNRMVMSKQNDNGTVTIHAIIPDSVFDFMEEQANQDAPQEQPNKAFNFDQGALATGLPISIKCTQCGSVLESESGFHVCNNCGFTGNNGSKESLSVNGSSNAV